MAGDAAEWRERALLFEKTLEDQAQALEQLLDDRAKRVSEQNLWQAQMSGTCCVSAFFQIPVTAPVCA